MAHICYYATILFAIPSWPLKFRRLRESWSNVTGIKSDTIQHKIEPRISANNTLGWC